MRSHIPPGQIHGKNFSTEYIQARSDARRKRRMDALNRKLASSEKEELSQAPAQVPVEKQDIALSDERDKATSVDSEKLAPKKDKTEKAPIPVKKDIANLTQAEKLGEVLILTVQKLPSALGSQLKALINPTSLAVMVGVIGAYAASHAVGIGFVADAVMGVSAGLFLGWQAVDVAKDLWAFAQYVNATTEEELDKAADHLAKAIMTVGFDVILGILTKKAAGKVSQHIDELKQVDEVHAHSNDVNAGRVNDVDNVPSNDPNKVEIEEPRRNQSTQADNTLNVADQSARATDEITSNIKSRINSSPDKFDLRYTDSEIDNFIQEGKKLGLDDATIEDLIFVGSRKAKPITSGELITQMDNYANTVSKRGYPYKFTDLEQFNSFKADLLSGLQSIGISIDDVRIQGSSLRTPNANDVDLVTLVDDAQFDKLLIDRYGNRIKLKTDDIGIDLLNKSHDELINLAQEIEANKQLYNGQSKTFAKAMLDRFFNSKSDISKPLKQLRKKLTSDYPNLNIEAIAVQTKGGEFDLQPFLNIE